MKVTRAFCSLLLASCLVSPAFSQWIYSTNFDGPEFNEGVSINGQGSWLAGVTSGGPGTVQPSVGLFGSRAVRFNASSRGFIFTSRVEVPGGLTNPGNYSASVRLWIDPLVGGQRLFGLYAARSNRLNDFTSLGVTVAADGGIRGGNTYAQTYGSILSTITDYRGKWLTLSIAKTSDNSASISVSGFGADNLGSFSTNISGAIGNVHSFHIGTDFVTNTNSTGIGYFDNFSAQAVPEPATLFTLGAGALVALFRRKKA